jgi:hypothetical protein
LAQYREDHARLISPDSFNLYVAKVELQRELKALLSTIDMHMEPSDNSRDHVKVVLYFDEAHVLADTHAVLCSCFNAFLDNPVFVIFLSTNFDVEKLVPSGELAKSARAHNNADILQAPITETPFDCARELYIFPKQYKLDQTYSIEFMSMFGRPV